MYNIVNLVLVKESVHELLSDLIRSIGNDFIYPLQPTYKNKPKKDIESDQKKYYNNLYKTIKMNYIKSFTVRNTYNKSGISPT